MQGKRAVITGDILKAKARELWQRLPQYKPEMEEPKWSNGWLESFKKKFNIKQYVQHGEGAAADINSDANIAQITELRDLCSRYPEKDTFNMNETGLFWKIAPTRSLATESTSGEKKIKDWLTLAFTINAMGSKKLDMWVIRSSKSPRCFKNINLKHLNIQYRHNKSKWMTGLIMKGHLEWLDDRMKYRKILLPLDNFAGHELAVRLVGGLEGLQNVRIAWLPPNTTSHWQPLDQGIIASFKLASRRQCALKTMRHILNCRLRPNRLPKAPRTNPDTASFIFGTYAGAVQLVKWLDDTEFFTDTCPRFPATNE
ncbi:hypothetical protein K3495_g5308 [Podosphaera aphanis]|nr:hypothetical protein K3495_g5308 [Podosphaera aphanis]